MNPVECIEEAQRQLVASGLYSGPIDGDPGPLTRTAVQSWKRAHVVPDIPVVTMPHPGNGSVDSRSEECVLTLDPHVQQPFRDLLNAINAQTVPQFGLTGKWIFGYRGEAKQNALYAQGRTAPGPIVTHAPWPYSAHNGGGGPVGYACDIAFFDANGNDIESGPKYEAATQIAIQIDRAMGFHSGADFNDPDHHCLRPPSMNGLTEKEFINEMIRRVQNGIPVWS